MPVPPEKIPEEGQSQAAETNGVSLPRENLWAEIRGALAGRPRTYTEGSLGRAILALAVPMVLEMSMQAVFSVVDVFFVGKLGAGAVTVVGISDALLTLVFAIAMGLSMGIAAMVARRVGEGRPRLASRAAVQALLLGGAFSVVMGLPGYLFAPELLQLMGATPEVARQGTGFTSVLLGTNITVMLLFLINAIFRGAGDAAIAMRALWLANLANIVLDPLLIFGYAGFPELGLTGAAVATTVGRGLGVAYQFYELQRGKGVISIGREDLRLDPAVMARLLRVSSIGMLQYLVGTASWLVVVRILALYGAAAVAGYTISVRIIIFALLPSWGMGNAAATLVGQCLGAGKPDRAARSVWLSGFCNMVFLGLVSMIFILWADRAVAIFSDQPEVLEVAASCLVIVSYSYVFLAFGMVVVQAFNGAGDTTTPTWINLFSYWVFELPCAYWLAVSRGWGPEGVFVAIALAQVVVALVGALWFQRGAWKRRQI